MRKWDGEIWKELGVTKILLPVRNYWEWGCHLDTSNTINAGWAREKSSEFLFERQMPHWLKGHFYQTTVILVMVYGASHWATEKQGEAEVDAMNMCILETWIYKGQAYRRRFTGSARKKSQRVSFEMVSECTWKTRNNPWRVTCSRKWEKGKPVETRDLKWMRKETADCGVTKNTATNKVWGTCKANHKQME